MNKSWNCEIKRQLWDTMSQLWNIRLQLQDKKLQSRYKVTTVSWKCDKVVTVRYMVAFGRYILGIVKKSHKSQLWYMKWQLELSCNCDKVQIITCNLQLWNTRPELQDK